MTKHRGRNEGSISERNGKYRAQVTLGNGERVSKTFKTKKEASAWILEQKNTAQAGIIIRQDVKTLADYAKIWLTGIQLDRAASTYEDYERYWRNDIEPAFGRIPLRDISPIDLERFFQEKRKAGRGARTVQYMYAVMHALFQGAKEAHLIALNPCDGFDRPSYKKARIIPPKVEDIKRLVTLDILSPYEESFYYLASTTAMRKGEVFGLMWADIDFSQQTLKVQRQVRWVKGIGATLCPLKTEDSYRTVHLSDHAVELLQAHQTRQQLEKAAKKGWIDLGLVFPSNKGTPKNPSNFQKRYQVVRKEAGIEKARFHHLRHKAITLAKVEFQMDDALVKEMVGHSPKSRVTEDEYTHSTEEISQFRKIAEGFDAKFGYEKRVIKDVIGEDYQI